MIRLAKQTDIDDVEKIFNEILDTPEMVHTTNWLKDGYPTRADAQKALDAGTLYVGEDETGGLYGAVNLNHIQPPEYAKIPWKIEPECSRDEVLVIHTLCIRPNCAGKGYGREFVAFSEQLAREKGCRVVRLDTYEGNRPAESLYSSLGYTLAGKTLFHFHNVIWETLICMEKKL